jgi:predicted alpha/beta hydrolase
MPKAVAIVVKGQRQWRRWSKLNKWLELKPRVRFGHG